MSWPIYSKANSDLDANHLITNKSSDSLIRLLKEISACQACQSHLEPRPVVSLGTNARLLIIGQAPGTRVHASGIPWNDASGKRLRQWLNLNHEQFYNTANIAIMPMGFCYPGKGRSGDLPPRPECQHLWHQRVLNELPNIKSTLLIGQYAQRAYLKNAFTTLTENVKNWQQWFPQYIPLPHPSPRNQLWLKQRPWFEAELLPVIKEEIYRLLFNTNN